MESVPETERMEEFKSSPLPPLRLHSLPPLAELDFARKPPTMRRVTDPASPSTSTSSGSSFNSSSPSWLSPAAVTYRPRTTSPLSGAYTHTRSKSAASLAPPMIRTQSLPGVNGAGHILYSPQGSQSPSRSPVRPQQIRLPKKPVDEAFPTSPTRVSVVDPDRRLLERNSSPNLNFISSAPLARTRRPASPLRHVAIPSSVALSGASSPTTPSSAYGSSYGSLPSSYMLASSMPSSSMPSTPTSTRSRSPSISSLETIPDSPDAEEAALEAERIAQLKAAADAADRVEGAEPKARAGSLDVPTRGRTLSGFGSRDKRKRWSVCGAERRGDIDLETVWEE